MSSREDCAIVQFRGNTGVFVCTINETPKSNSINCLTTSHQYQNDRSFAESHSGIRARAAAPAYNLHNLFSTFLQIRTNSALL